MKYILLAALSALCIGCGEEEKKGNTPNPNLPSTDMFDKSKGPGVSKDGPKPG